MQNIRRQFSFPQFRFPWTEPDQFERMEKKRGKPYSHHTEDTLISVGYPCSYCHVDHGTYSGCTVDHDIMTNDTDISKGLIFRRDIREGVLFAKTLTLPFGDPNIEYNWKLDKPIEYPDAIEQHQYLTKRYTRNIGMFDIREHAIDEMCEDLQYGREQVIRSSIVIAFGNRDTAFRKYIVHPTGPNLDRLVMKSVMFLEKNSFSSSGTDCTICELPFEVPKIEIIKDEQLISRITSISYISIEGRDMFDCRTDSNYFIFEANPPNSDETFKQTLKAIFPNEIVSTDLSPHIRNESAVLIENGLLYIVSKYGSTRLALPEEHKWVSVIFGPHPRFVICANEKSVFACQLKKGVICSYERLYRVKQDRIMALTRHPRNAYIFALATLNTIFLLDTRQPDIPYFSISPELNGPIEFLLLLPYEHDKVKVLVDNRDGEVRIFAFRGGIGLTTEDAPNPPYQSEMLILSDTIEDNMILLTPEIYFSCRKRFETNSGGVTCLFLPNTNTELKYTLIISISVYGDLSWQQLIQTKEFSQISSVLIKPTNEDYTQLLNWAGKGRNQYFRNFRIQEIYFDFLVESMEYFYANKILEWLFRAENKCYTCYEMELEFNTKNFPSLNKLYFQSGWPKYSNWAKCDFGNQIPSLRYTRISLKDIKLKKRENKFEKKNSKRHLIKLPDSTRPQNCSCQLTTEDFIGGGELDLPWENMVEVPVDCSGLFLDLWTSWPIDTELGEKEIQTGTGTNRCLEVIEEISVYFETDSPVKEIGESICDQSNDFDNIPKEPPVAIVIEDKHLTPFPKKGAKNKNSKENTNKQTETTEDKQTDLEIYSSDPDWPMDWTDFSNTSFSNYNFLGKDPSASQMSAPGEHESSLSRFPPMQSTPQTQPLSSKGTTPSVKKEKRKIGF